MIKKLLIQYTINGVTLLELIIAYKRSPELIRIVMEMFDMTKLYDHQVTNILLHALNCDYDPKLPLELLTKIKIFNQDFLFRY